MERRWIISLIETDQGMSAIIERADDFGSERAVSFSVNYADYDGDRDEAIADLFAGPLPNIRDSFDTV